MNDRNVKTESGDADPGSQSQKPLGLIDSAESAIRAANVCAPAHPLNYRLTRHHSPSAIKRFTREIWPLQQRIVELDQKRASRKPGTDSSLTNPNSIWFRGEADKTFTTVPQILRRTNLEANTERLLFQEFQLRFPEQRHDHQSTIEWLGLMQHHNLPTRLLDWSENILIALYFAVHELKDKDGALIVLNAPLMNRLNAITTDEIPRSEHFRLYSPSSFNVLARALMARYNSASAVFKSKELDWFGDGDGPGTFNHDVSKLFDKQVSKPVAFFPHRANVRLAAQSGTFTVHGEPLNSPADLKSHSNYVRYYKIRAEHKAGIERDLQSVGIHEGTVYPEMDRMATFLREQYGFAR